MDRRRLVFTGAGLVGALWAIAAPAAGQGLALFGETDLARIKTEYNDIIVRRSGDEVRLLFEVGRCEFAQSAWKPADPSYMPFEYTRAITAALVYPANPRSILEIGLGGGRTSMYLKRFLPEARITSVEIDPGVVAVAKRYFGVVEDRRLSLVVDDGRRYVGTSKASYDLIIIDAYRGTWVPETLTTVEFFQLVKARLAPGGVVAQNVEPTTLFFDGMLATLRAVFANVDVLPTGGDEVNAVLIAYDGPAKTQAALAARAEALQKARNFRHPLPGLVSLRERTPRQVAAQPFRDSFERANEMLMIDRANDPDTPRQRSERCKA